MCGIGKTYVATHVIKLLACMRRVENCSINPGDRLMIGRTSAGHSTSERKPPAFARFSRHRDGWQHQSRGATSERRATDIVPATQGSGRTPSDGSLRWTQAAAAIDRFRSTVVRPDAEIVRDLAGHRQSPWR